MMELDKTLDGLHRLRDKTTCFACSGCGMEHNCSDDGCRIIRSSIEQLQKISKELATSEAARTELWKQLVSARQELAEAKAERDAAIKLLRSMYWCYGCVHLGQPFSANSGCELDKLLECNEGHDLYEFGVREA